jgi:hypothetical protein
MSQAFNLSKITGQLSLSVNLKDLSPEQQRDLIFELLRTTQVAYVPELQQSIEAVSAALNFYVSPTKAEVPHVDPFLRLTREEKRRIVVGLLDASIRKDDEYIKLSSRLNAELPGNAKPARKAFAPVRAGDLTDQDIGRKARAKKFDGTPFEGRIEYAPSRTLYRFQLVHADGVKWLGLDKDREVEFI